MGMEYYQIVVENHSESYTTGKEYFHHRVPRIVGVRKMGFFARLWYKLSGEGREVTWDQVKRQLGTAQADAQAGWESREKDWTSTADSDLAPDLVVDLVVEIPEKEATRLARCIFGYEGQTAGLRFTLKQPNRPVNPAVKVV